MRSPSILAAAIALATTAAHAEPSLPAGWIAGGKAAPMPAEAPPSPRSREALQLAASPLRPAIEPVPVALDALDLVEIAPALTDKEVEAGNATQPAEPAPEVFVAPGCQRVSVSGHAVGELRLGWLSEPIGPQSTGGVDTWHVRGSRGGGDGRHRFTRVTWETIDPLPDGTLRYTHGEARFDVFTCKTTLASRYTAVARPILGGLAFLFRTRCAACAPAERDELHVIKPSFGWGNEAYGHRTLPLRAESADSTRTRIEPARLQRFAKAVGRSLPALATGQDMLIGIETVKGLGEAAPNVIAYATVVKHIGL
jgi:hypothetical protein